MKTPLSPPLQLPEPRTRLTAGITLSLADGIRRLVAPNAGMMTGTGTNTYLLGTREVTVLDPGPDDPRHLQAILDAGAGRIRWIVVTHTHRDHSPLAAALAAATGARAIGVPPPTDGRQDDTFRPDVLPRDGERLQLGDVALTAIHTPGHASNCVCYLEERQHVLFTGDHVLEGVSPVILPPDGDMSSYLESLEKLRSYDVALIAPGHGGLIGSCRATLEALYRHRMARESHVLRCLMTLGAASLEQLTAVVYKDVPVALHSWAQQTLHAHLIKLQRDGRVVESARGWRPAG